MYTESYQFTLHNVFCRRLQVLVDELKSTFNLLKLSINQNQSVSLLHHVISKLCFQLRFFLQSWCISPARQPCTWILQYVIAKHFKDLSLLLCCCDCNSSSSSVSTATKTVTLQIRPYVAKIRTRIFKLWFVEETQTLSKLCHHLVLEYDSHVSECADNKHVRKNFTGIISDSYTSLGVCYPSIPQVAFSWWIIRIFSTKKYLKISSYVLKM